MAFRWDVRVNWWVSPRIITVLAPSTDISIQDLVDTCRELEQRFSNMAFPHLINAAGKEDLGGGISVGITATLQNAVLQFEGRTCPLLSGVATENDTTGQTLTAAGSPNGNFITNGVQQGYTVFNAVNAGMATILSVDSEDQLTSQPLKNCAGASWTIGDPYVIYENVVASVLGGNLVALDENDQNVEPMLQSPNVNYVRTSSSSATLQDLESIQSGVYNGMIVIDPTLSTTGTEFPYGTFEQPVNNLDDALAISAERGLKRFHIHNTLTITSGDVIENYRIEGDGPAKSIIIVETGANITNCEFTSVYLVGDLDSVIVRESVIGTGSKHISGFLFQCAIEGTFTPSDVNEPLHILSCYSLVPGLSSPILDLTGYSGSMALRDYTGGIRLINADSNPTMSIDMSAGTIHLDPSVSTGLYNCRGVSILNNNSTGTAVVYDDGIVNKIVNADAVWDEDLSTHTVAGSAGNTVTQTSITLDHLAKFSTNRSLIDATANTLTIFDDDGVTPVAVFDLIDSTGTPSVTQIFERNPNGSP